MFITFEGIDGSGKSTQISLLAKFLEELGHEVVTTREPGGTEFSEQIRELLLFSKQIINPIAELFLFEAARAQLITSVINPSIESNKIVISDRYYDSTVAYQGYGRGLNIEDILMCNAIIDKYGAKPDLTFFLDVSFENSLKRRKNSCINKIDKIEHSGEVFFQKVIDGYRKIANDNPERIVTIDANSEKHITFEKIKNKILEFL